MAVKITFILMLIGYSLFGQEMLITYYSKCDAIVFTSGRQSTDTIYNTSVDVDSLAAGHLDYYYTPDTMYHVEPEDLVTVGLEVTVNRDSLTADTVYGTQ